MAADDDFQGAFERLRELLQRHADHLVCVHDEPGHYYLDTHHIMKNRKPLYFGSVQIRKAYVSYHLMPVYVQPALLESVSGDLLRRMQGKSCFNFRKVDETLFAELDALTEAGFEAYRTAGYV